MRSQQKSGRGRGKNNRNKGAAHSPNRVYESAGPEGKVRGTPQQIIDKYQALARDAQLSGDRVASENFLQHAEHYARILSAVQEAQAERQQQQQPQTPPGVEAVDQPVQNGAAASAKAMDIATPLDDQPPSDGLAAIDAAHGEAPALVETPETQNKKPARSRRPRPKPKAEAPDDRAAAPEPAPAPAPEAEAAPAPEAPSEPETQTS